MNVKGLHYTVFILIGAMSFYYWLSTPQYSVGKIVEAIASEDIDELKKHVMIKEVSLLSLEKYFISSKRQAQEKETDLPKYALKEVDDVSYKELGCSKVLCHYILTINYAEKKTPVMVKMDLTKEGPRWLISKLEDLSPIEEYFSK